MRLAISCRLRQSCAQANMGERMKTRWIFAGLLAGSALSTLAPAQAHAETRLLRDPALSDNALAFAYAGDIWIAESDGSNPRRPTSHPANERDPIFSPDGSMIAFTATYDEIGRAPCRERVSVRVYLGGHPFIKKKHKT